MSNNIININVKVPIIVFLEKNWALMELLTLTIQKKILLHAVNFLLLGSSGLQHEGQCKCHWYKVQYVFICRGRSFT